MTLTRNALTKATNKVDAMKRAMANADRQSPELMKQLHDARVQLLAMKSQLDGNSAKNEIGERNPLSPGDGQFIGFVALSTTYGPTANHIKAFNRAQSQLAELRTTLNVVTGQTMPQLEKSLEALGAPVIEE